MKREYSEVEESSDELVEMTTKFSGIILRKAEIEKNFEGTYSRVIEKMVEYEYFDSNRDLVEILGRSGG